MNRQAAREAGSVKYVGRPCPRGHNGVRYTKSARCVDCCTEWGWMQGKGKDGHSPRIEARIKGDVTYQGPECKRGHGGMRYVSNACCIQCVANNKKNWRAAA